MEERSFRRATLFGVLGALVFLVLGVILREVFHGLKTSTMFRIHTLRLDLLVIAIHIRVTLFVVVGFIVGWAYCLFKGTRRAKTRADVR